MSQNITTLLEKPEITAADIRSLESTVENFLYLVHGTGSTRDKKINLKQLRAWLSVLTELTLIKAFTGGISTVVLDGEKIELSATGTAVTDNSGLEISRQEIKFTRSVNSVALTVSITPGGVSISAAEGLNDPVVTSVTNDKVKTPTLETDRAVTEGLQAKNRSSFERINIGDSKSYFHYPDTSSVNINTLLENSYIEVAAGDVITIKCDNVNGNGLQVSFTEGDSMTGHVLISPFCAMQFICTSISNSVSHWAPLCNTSVSVF